MNAAEQYLRELTVMADEKKRLIRALDYLLEQTVDMDLAHGIALTEGEQEARASALAVLDEVRS